MIRTFPQKKKENYQREGVTPIACKIRKKIGIQKWFEKKFVDFAFRLLKAVDSACSSIAADEEDSIHFGYVDDEKSPISSWFKGFLYGWRMKDTFFSDEINISWSIEDILNVRSDLSIDQCKEILNLIKKQHDATVGITWECISDIAEYLYPSE